MVHYHTTVDRAFAALAVTGLHQGLFLFSEAGEVEVEPSGRVGSHRVPEVPAPLDRFVGQARVVPAHLAGDQKTRIAAAVRRVVFADIADRAAVVPDDDVRQ